MNVVRSLLVVLSLALFAAPAAADWPVFAHDALRTGATPGPAAVKKPITRWKTYIGGNLGPRQFLARDVTGDGGLELFFVSGARIVARHADGSELWSSKILDAAEIVDLTDLDGDGEGDLIVKCVDRIVLLRAKTGALEWDSASWSGRGFAFGAIGAVRLADLNGDGALDLFMAAQWAGGSSNTDLRLATAFNFRTPGSRDQPEVLFDHRDTSPSERDYLAGGNDVLADVDGDGHLDWVAFGTSHVYVYTTRAETTPPLAAGALKTASEDLGTFPYGGLAADTVDLDGDGKQDLVLYVNNNYNAAVNSRRVLVVGWHSVMSATTFGRWWQQSVTDLDNDIHGFAQDGAADLDGDGKLDVTTSFFDHVTQKWRLLLIDGVTGTVKATQNDAGRMRGVVDLGTQRGALVEASDGLRVYAIDAGAWVLKTSFANAVAVTAWDRSRARQKSAADVLLRAQACGDQTLEALAYEKNAAGQPILLEALQLGSGVACNAKYMLSGDRFLNVYALGQGGIAAARSSGFLTTLDLSDGLVPYNLGNSGEFSSPGVRIGGYYAGAYGHHGFPIAPQLASHTPVIAADSHGNLVAYDVGQASLIKPPKRLWSLPNVTSPSAFDVTGSSALEVLAYEGQTALVLDGESGQKLSALPFPKTPRTPNNDILAARLDGDAQVDLVLDLLDDGNGTSEVYAVDGANGSPRWAMPRVDTWAGCVGPDMALAPLTAGKAPDVMAGACGGIFALAGDTGVSRGAITGVTGRTTMCVDVNDDGALDLVTTGAYHDVTATDAALTTLWQNTHFTPNYSHYSAFLACPGVGPRFGSARWQQPIFFILDGKTGMPINGADGVVLAEGQVFVSTAEALSAGKRPGVLGNTTGVGELLGAGTGSRSFLVGSTDGYLYAFNACDGQLRWSLDMGSPVSQAIVADVQGRGRDQIIVTTADGYLRGVDDEILPAPMHVRDVDLSADPSGMQQIYEVTTVDSLQVAWDPVPGATRYECAVIDANDELVPVGGDFVDCGTGTSATNHGLPLVDGVTYRQAVRAVGADGTSVETLSPGVRVHLKTAAPSDGGVDGGGSGGDESGCGCTLGGRGRTAPAIFLIALVAILILRRRRRA